MKKDKDRLKCLLSDLLESSIRNSGNYDRAYGTQGLSDRIALALELLKGIK